MADTWKAMKGKQKARITELMFKSVCEVYKKTGKMPSEDQYEQLAREIFPKCNVKVLQYEDLLATFIKKQARFAERIEAHGIPEPKPPKVKKTEAEKLAIKRAARKRKKERKMQKALEAEIERYSDYDGTFCYIAGYTSGGVPYGLMWEQVGIDPELPFEEKVRLYESGEYDL